MTRILVCTQTVFSKQYLVTELLCLVSARLHSSDIITFAMYNLSNEPTLQPSSVTDIKTK